MAPDASDSLFVAVTADVDPDANRPRPGRADAVSAGAGDRATLGACFEGLAALADTLEALALPATLFWEGRTAERLSAERPDLLRALKAAAALEHGCHGHRHEDFAGAVSGVPLDGAQTAQAVERAGAAVRSAFGAEPRGFRAPYGRLTPHLLHALTEAPYAYDASLTRPLAGGWGLRPYRLEGAPRLWELALCRSRDRRGRPISCYLWQLFEGNRPVDDYVRLVRSARTRCPGGLLQIALHPWHLSVSAEGRPLGREPLMGLRELLRRVLELDGVTPTTVGAYLAASSGGAREPVL